MTPDAPFLHESRDFDALIQIAANRENLSAAIVEKDYWVTHSLWAMLAQGFEVWFKGGTSLSKGFGLIRRFSEDLDLRLDHPNLPGPASWTGTSAAAVTSRRQRFEALAEMLTIPGASVQLQEDHDEYWRSANIAVSYGGSHVAGLIPGMKPFVLLEIGVARVVPCVERDLSSWVHAAAKATGQLREFRGNQPVAVRCVHPFVTLLEKLDAISRRFGRQDDPATFVRHYEDAAAIIRDAAGVSSIADIDVHALAAEMLAERDIRAVPNAADSAFQPDSAVHPAQAAWVAIGPMFWGERVSLADACALIRTWISVNVP